MPYRALLDHCRKCGKARDKFEYDELLKEEQLHWDESGILKQINFFLYCPNCDEYSATLELDEF